jgi:hypothetical protein
MVGRVTGPIESKARPASALPRQCESGGNSTMRSSVPAFGGSSLTGRAAASALPALLAGEAVVSHRSVSATPGIDSISLTFGARPSIRKKDRPVAS